MSIQVQLRGGTSSQNNGFTGAAREVTIDTTLQTLRVHDGITQGGTLIFGRRSILGTVSQSAGVPTGAVIQRGSNASGEFVRFADGTQICWQSVTPDYDNAGGTQTFTLPASFASGKPRSAAVSAVGGSGGNKSDFRSITAWGATANSSFLETDGSRAGSGSSEIRITTFGPWF